MGEFHDAVTTLLEAFSRGLAVIKRKRAISSSTDKSKDLTLKKSLKRSRSDVQTAYGREMGRVGPGFANGDGKSAISIGVYLPLLYLLTFGESWSAFLPFRHLVSSECWFREPDWEVRQGTQHINWLRRSLKSLQRCTQWSDSDILSTLNEAV